MTKTKETKAQATGLAITGLPPIKFDVTAAGLKKLTKECAAFTKAPETTADYKALTVQIAKVRNTRTGIEGRRVEVQKPVLVWQKALNAKATELKTTLAALEATLVALKVIADEAKAKAKKLKIKAEQQRLADLNEKLAEIRRRPRECFSADDYEMALQEVGTMEISVETHQEFAQLAEVARQEVLMALRQGLAEQHELAAEAEAAEEKRQLELAEMETTRQAQDKKAAEQAKAQKALDKKADEIEAKEKALEAKEKAAQAKLDEADRLAREAQETEDRELAEKEAATKLKKEAAAQAKQKKAWRNKMATDLPALENYLTDLNDLTQPKCKTSEAATMLANVRVTITEAMLEADGFKTYLESEGAK